MIAIAVPIASTPPITTSRARMSISSGSRSGRSLISTVIGRVNPGLQRRGEKLTIPESRDRRMLDLRTLEPARQSADRRVALVAGFVVVATCTLASVAAGSGGWALAWGGAAALGGLPWFFAFGARWRLLDDALAGVPFAWRGDRMGVWATAPVAGALL